MDIVPALIDERLTLGIPGHEFCAILPRMIAPRDTSSHTGASRGWERPVSILLATAVSAAAYALATGLQGIALFAWVAPIPVLLLAYRSSAKISAAAAFAVYLAGSLRLVPYLARVMPPVPLAVTLVFPAVAFAACVLAARFAQSRLAPWCAVFAFPAAWTSYEYLLYLVSPHGTAGSIAYTQMDFLPLIQIASLAGIWGVTFLLTLAPSAVAVAWQHRKLKRLLWSFGLPALLEIGALGWGCVQIRRPVSGDFVKAGLAATDSTVRYFDSRQRDQALPVLHDYARRIRQLASGGAEVVVLPEKFVGVAPAYEREALGILGDAARASRVVVVAGINRLGGSHPRNTALVFASDGRILLEYDKARLLPGAEDGYVSGRQAGIFGLPHGEAGVAICKDMDFPEWCRRYAREHVKLLCVPAWDFTLDAKLHSRMAVMRAVEGGFSLARCAQNGFATVCDYRGRIIAEAASFKSDEVLLLAAVPWGPGHTIYSSSGDWLAWLCLTMLAVIVGGSWTTAPRSIAIGA